MASVRAASSPFLSVITEPPIFKIANFALLNSYSSVLFYELFALFLH
jgi:hypothetical protein